MIKKKKQMMMTSLCMLLVATLALSSTSYAWFTQTNTATLDNVEFQAQAAEGLEISFDAKTWKSTLAVSDFDRSTNGYTYGNQSVSTITSAGEYFKPMSAVTDTIVTTDTASNSQLVFYTGSVDNGKIELKQTTDGYYAFNLYFRNSGATTKTLILASDTSSAVATPTTGKHMDYAVRAAFLDQGYTNIGSGDTAAAIGLIGATSASATIWEPNAASHTDASGITAATKQSYDGIKQAGTVEISGSSAANVISSTTYLASVTTVETKDDATIATLLPNTITKVTVYVWLEGQDVDCINAESGSSVVMKFGFATKNITA